MRIKFLLTKVYKFLRVETSVLYQKNKFKNNQDCYFLKLCGEKVLKRKRISLRLWRQEQLWLLYTTMLSGDSMSSLLYIWPLYIHGAEPATNVTSGVKIWHPPRTGREKGVRGGEEEGWRGRKLQ
jgi:hypothetical protein